MKRVSGRVLAFLLSLTLVTTSVELPVMATEASAGMAATDAVVEESTASGEAETEVIETEVVETTVVETGVIETEVVETTVVETEVVETTVVETEVVETTVVETEVVETEVVETEVVETEVVETEVIETEVIETEVVETEVVETEVIETEVVETEEAVETETDGWDGVTMESVYETDDYIVTFKLTGAWDGGYNANVRIDNTTDTDIENWKMQLEYAGTISNIWNAVIESSEAGKYIIKNAGWNQDITAGSYIEFGLSGQESFAGFPTAYEMLGAKGTTSEEDYAIEYTIQSDWGSGFVGLITITNNTDSVIEDWSLEFDGENEIASIWNAIIESHEGTHYVIKNAGYNQNIAVGESVSFGFIVNGGSSENAFINFVLSKYADNEEQNEEQLPEREKEPLESIGEAYYKEPTADDIVIDEESGVQYIKNQLLISAYMGAEKAIFEEIAAEVGAQIVGYIELTNDYQIEFNENKTLEEMILIAEYIDSYSFVSMVTLNFYEDTVSLMTQTNDALYNDGQTCYRNYTLYDSDGDGVGDSVGTDFTSANDTWYESAPKGDNWGLEAIKALSAWDHKSTFDTVKVGVYDCGFAEHEDLIYDDIVNNTTDPDQQDHGTHVSGTIAAQHDNGIGISGVATDTRLYAYATSGTDYGSAMGNKIAYATLIGNHVKVINVSLGWANTAMIYAASHGNTKAQNFIQDNADALEEYLNKLVAAGYDFVICVAAGNTDDDQFVVDTSATYGYRAASDTEIADASITKYSGGTLAKYGYNLTAIDDSNLMRRIIVVGAMQNDGLGKYSKAWFSNYGDRVDFMAPGVDILSTVPTTADPTGYMLMNGTSMATPHVTGLVAMMFQANPAMRASNVKSYITKSCTKTLTYDSKTYNIPDAESCYNYIQSVFTTNNNDNTWPSGIVCGYTKNLFGAAVDNVSITAIRKSTGEYNLGQYSFTFTSDAEGYYMQTLPQGTYDFVVSKSGYLPYSIKGVVVNPDETTYMETIALGVWATTINGSSGVQGTVKDALYGTAVSAATVKLRKGWNNQTGNYVKNIFGVVRSATTDANGAFKVSVGVGSYTAEITKNGYVVAYYNVIAVDSGITAIANTTMVLTPILAEDEYRIVLTWGDTPRDLDSHLTYYVDGVQQCHVYYSNKVGKYEGETIAKLDLDDVTSYGPETVTITLDASLVEEGGEFRYSVHNFSGRSSSNSNAMSLSNATVRVYAGNNIVKTFYIPKDQVGTVWHVFDITSDGIRAVNDFYNATSALGVQ